MASKKCLKKLKEIAQLIHDNTELESFAFYGGHLLDIIFTDADAKYEDIHDLDIAVKMSPKYLHKIRDSLLKKGFKIVIPKREYVIYKNKKVVLLYTKKGGFFYDIVLLDDYDLLGQFSIDSMYYTCPDFKLIDKHEGIKALEEKKIIPIRGLKNENPYLLIGRFFVISAKYNIDLRKSFHRKIIEDLNSILKRRTYSEKSIQYPSCLSSILKAILISENRVDFVKNIKDSDILAYVFPELNKSLFDIDFSNTKNKEKIKICKNKKELAEFFLMFIREEKIKKSFKDRLKCLNNRIWNKEDIEVANL